MRNRQLRRYRPHGAFTFAMMAVFVLPALCSAQQVDRIEEDWELIVGEPDSATNAPQVTCMMSPSNSAGEFYATFELNYQSSPEFVPGGMQLQTWNYECPISTHKFPNGAQMSAYNETVTWTQRMSLSVCSLTFEVLGGSSTTWGNFGGQGYLRANAESCFGSLGGYNPATSVANSGVSYASNRVVRLALKEVRYYSGSQLVYTDTTERVAWER